MKYKYELQEPNLVSVQFDDKEFITYTVEPDIFLLLTFLYDYQKLASKFIAPIIGNEDEDW
jgi:hypothetical protein